MASCVAASLPAATAQIDLTLTGGTGEYGDRPGRR